MLQHISIGNGPPILLLPGMLGTVDSEWRGHMEAIAAMGYKVIAADWPGHARSEMSKSFTFRVLTEEIDSLLKGLSTDPVVIFGYSMGGYAALNYAIKNPTRVVGIWMHGVKFFWSGEEADQMSAELDIEWLTENNPERLEKMRGVHGDQVVELMPWLNKMVVNMPDTGLTPFDLGDLQVPILVSVGDRDELVPVSEAVDLFGALPKGQLAVFADTNHPMQSLRDHVMLPVVKDFLNRLD